MSRGASPITARWCWQGRWRAPLPQGDGQEVLGSEDRDWAAEQLVCGPGHGNSSQGPAMVPGHWPHCLLNPWPVGSSLPKFPEPWQALEPSAQPCAGLSVLWRRGGRTAGGPSQAALRAKRGLAAPPRAGTVPPPSPPPAAEAART